MNSTVYVDIPRDHHVMTSFENIFLSDESRLTVSASDYDVWAVNSRVIKTVRLFPRGHGGRLVVSLDDCVKCYTQHTLRYGEGFRLRFTFHPVSKL